MAAAAAAAVVAVVVVVVVVAVAVAVAARHLQRAAEVLHHPLDIHGERRRRRVHAAVHLLLLHGLAPLEERVVPVALRLALLFDLPQRVADVADDLGVREVDRVDLGRYERDVEDDGLRSGEGAGSEVVVVVVAAAAVALTAAVWPASCPAAQE